MKSTIPKFKHVEELNYLTKRSQLIDAVVFSCVKTHTACCKNKISHKYLIAPINFQENENGSKCQSVNVLGNN